MADISERDLTHAALLKKRRHAAQDRSIRTVARILDAAKSLLARLPYEEVTTTRIAAERGISVGGLYRFFPDKNSIIDAVDQRHRSQLRNEVEDGIVLPMYDARHREDFDPVPLFIRMFDMYVTYLDSHADLRTITFGRDRREMSGSFTWECPGLTMLLADFLGLSGRIILAPERKNTLRLAGEAGERLIAYAFEQPTREQRDRILTEAKKMLVLYLFPK
jgi:AcrR family transcriptional regulator